MSILLTEDRLEIWKLERPLYECRPKPVEWGKLGIPNLAGMSLIESYWMLQNTNRENQQGV